MKGTGDLVGTPDPRAQHPGTSAAGPGRGDVGATAPNVTLNLAEASIPAAAKAVLGDIMRANYTISDKVKGTVSLQTPQPVARARLLEMFEAALQAQGAAIVTTSGIMRILPSDEALAAGAPIQPQGASRNIAGMSTQVVQLRFVTAPDMERLLKSVAPQSSAVRVDPQRNLVILTANRNDLASLNDAISVFDVDWMRGMSFAIFPVESADPDAIAGELDIVFANDGLGKGIVRFIPNRRLKSILVVTARPDYLHRAEQWLRKLDLVGRATEKQVHAYHVQNRPAVELAQLLQRVYAGQDQSRDQSRSQPLITGSLQTPTPSASPSSSSSAAFPAGDGASRTSGSTGATGGAGAGLPALPPVPVVSGPAVSGPVASGIGSAALPGGSAIPIITPETGTGRGNSNDGLVRPIDDRNSGISVIADEHNNSLVITATAAEYKRIRQILAGIDVAPHQVLIEATIAEVTLNDQLKLGMRWYFERNPHSIKFTDSPVGDVTSVFPGFSYFLNAANVKVVLNALSAVTNVNIVSQPSLMVLDNKKAVLQVGDEVPVTTQSAVAVLTPGAPIVNSVAFRNTGILLSITPRISDKGRVLLDIEQEVSNVVPTTSSGIDSPTIQQRRVRTTVAVDDGESVVLAGMIQDKATRDRTQIPLLGDWPVVGNMFKNKTDTIQRTELLIAITPRIVQDRHQMRHIVDEYRDKLNFNTRPRRDRLPDRNEMLDRLQR
jgi:general secretion pathway protein D